MNDYDKKGESQSSYSTSLLKTLSILDQFTKTDELGIKELSVNTGIPASTVQRIVNTLVMRQYLEQNPYTLKYSLGIALYNLCGNYSNNKKWIEQVQLQMEHLVELHKETVNLAVLQDDHIVYLTKADSPQVLRPNFTVGAHYPVLTTSLGRCLLAFQPKGKLEKWFSSNGISSSEAAKYYELFAEIRKNGYAMEDEKFQIGLFCIAAPVFQGNNQVVAAMSMTIPKARLNYSDLNSMIQDLKDTALRASMEMQRN